MERVQYRDYVIEANPHELHDDGRWSMDIVLERHDGSGIEVRPYTGANTFATKEEAIRHCINFGRQIIDGQIRGCMAP